MQILRPYTARPREYSTWTFGDVLVVCLPVLLEIDGLVAAGGGGGRGPPAQLEVMPVLLAAQMTQTENWILDSWTSSN